MPSDNTDLADTDAAERLREKYPDWYDRSWVETSYKLLRHGIDFENASPKRKAQITKHFNRRLKVYGVIREPFLGGPKSFTAVWKVVGGSRSTVSNCLKGLCEEQIVKRDNITRQYELISVGWRDLRQIRTPSAAYCKRLIRNSRTTVSEDCSASFYPRSGFVRIAESKPNLEAAMAALLNPIYLAVRKSGTTRFDIEIN